MSYVATQLNYVFNPATATVSFSGQPNFDPRYVKAITNQTRNAFLYLPGIAGYGGTWDSTNTKLTLQVAVSTHATGDILLIQYDDQTDDLADIESLLAGGTVLDYKARMRTPGAVMQSPNLEDLFRSLIAEVRMNTMLFAQASGNDADLDAYKATILETMQR
jgi:hypothetical protein